VMTAISLYLAEVDNDLVVDANALNMYGCCILLLTDVVVYLHLHMCNVQVPQRLRFGLAGP